MVEVFFCQWVDLTLQAIIVDALLQQFVFLCAVPTLHCILCSTKSCAVPFLFADKRKKSLFLSMHRHLESLALAIHYLMVLLIQYTCWVSFLIGKHQHISDLELIKAGCKRIKDQGLSQAISPKSLELMELSKSKSHNYNSNTCTHKHTHSCILLTIIY